MHYLFNVSIHWVYGLRVAILFFNVLLLRVLDLASVPSVPASQLVLLW